MLARRSRNRSGEHPGYLWYGNVYEALLEFRIVEMLIYNSEETGSRFGKLERAVREFCVYIEHNRGLIPSYGER